jgi:hypothetical protein
MKESLDKKGKAKIGLVHDVLGKCHLFASVQEIFPVSKSVSR